MIKYIYSATGEKLRTIHYTAPANIHVDVECDYEDIEHNYLAVDSTDYLCGGSVIYLNAKPSKILFDGGYLDINLVKGKQTQRPRRTAGMTDEEYRALIERWMQTLNRTELSYRFFTRDHLGNNRAVIDKSGTVRQKTDYYPSGTPFSTRAYTITSGFQPFKYNGKEFDMMHGLNTYDYGARQYYPLFAQWDRVDPLCEKYYNVSPYAYCANNPINRIDPDGQDWYQNNDNQYYTWYNGNKERKGFSHIGGKGSVLGEFEGIIDNILSGQGGLGMESLYSEGFTFDIAPNDKGALLASKKRGGNFFDEFVNGTGPEFSVLLENHPYTKEMSNDARVVWAQDKLCSGMTDIKGQITSVKRKFGIIDLLSTASFAKQFVGSYRYDGYTSKDGKYINNVITDSKSRTSLFYHPNLDTPRRKECNALGNTYQFYIWRSKK